MKRRSRILLATAALAALFLPQAMAADYEPPIYIDDAPEYVPVEIGSGWYLRGDVGYNFSVDTDAFEYRLYDPISGAYSPFAPFSSSGLDENLTYGVGVGFHFSDWLRADATLDSFDARFNGTIARADPCGGGAGTSCRVESEGEAGVISLMANAYVDLGTFVGFTPYVGAGAGMSHVDWSSATNTYFCVDGAATCAAALQGTTRHPGESDWRFAYALMAGMAWDISSNLKLDLGYRYRKIDGGDAAGWDEASAAAGAAGVQARDGGFETHEVRVGLRYDLW